MKRFDEKSLTFREVDNKMNSGKIKIEKIAVDFEFENDERKIGFLLAQLFNEFDETRVDTGYFLKDPDKKTKLIIEILKSSIISREKYSLKKINFILFPEVSVPESALAQIFDFGRNDMPINTVAIFGLEFIDISRYQQILNDSNNPDKNLDGNFDKANIAIIMIKSKSGSFSYYVQSKIKFADIERKFAGAYPGKEILVFELQIGENKKINFTQIICYDFICSIDNQELLSLISKEINPEPNWIYPLDFLINIQNNNKPQDEKFKNSISSFFTNTESNIDKDRTTIIFANSSNNEYFTNDSVEYGHSSLYVDFKYFKKDIDINTYKITPNRKVYSQLLFRENGPGVYTFLYKPIRYVKITSPDDTKPFDQCYFSRVYSSKREELYPLKQNSMCIIPPECDKSFLNRLTKSISIKEIYSINYHEVTDQLKKLKIKNFRNLIQNIFFVCDFHLDKSDRWEAKEKDSFKSFINYACILKFLSNFRFVYADHKNIEIEEMSVWYLAGNEQSACVIYEKIKQKKDLEILNMKEPNLIIILNDIFGEIPDDFNKKIYEKAIHTNHPQFNQFVNDTETKNISDKNQKPNFLDARKLIFANNDFSKKEEVQNYLRCKLR